MQIIRWGKRFVIGVPQIDGEHERLFQVLNEVYDHFLRQGHCQAVNARFAFFIEQLSAVFSVEEQCMYAHDYRKLQEHAAEHRQFLQKLATMQSGAEKESTVFSRFSFISIGNWLSLHILQADVKFAETLLLTRSNDAE